MRILVVEDEFERAGLHVEHLQRVAFAADHARVVGYTLAKSPL
ncbi:MAG: hypothetical protein WBQ53_08455 [Methylocystis sp.]